jgi:hypothetical protein
MTKAQIADLIEQTNRLLTTDFCPIKNASADVAKAFRLGLCVTLENVLHATNSYAGYMYQTHPYIDGVTDDSKRIYLMKAKIARVAKAAS